MEITSKVVKPENCIILFGIPTTKEEFFYDLKNPKKDFVKQFGGGWAQYYYQITSNIDIVIPAISEMGVTILSNISINQFKAVFEQMNYDIIILFSHWRDDSVEFREGLIDISTIIQNIPYNYNGIIDLCVCHPEKLTYLLRRDRPNCITKYIQKKATPYIWLYFYLVLFKKLKFENISYLHALESAITDFLSKN